MTFLFTFFDLSLVCIAITARDGPTVYVEGDNYVLLVAIPTQHKLHVYTCVLLTRQTPVARNYDENKFFCEENIFVS